MELFAQLTDVFGLGRRVDHSCRWWEFVASSQQKEPPTEFPRATLQLALRRYSVPSGLALRYVGTEHKGNRQFYEEASKKSIPFFVRV